MADNVVGGATITIGADASDFTSGLSKASEQASKSVSQSATKALNAGMKSVTGATSSMIGSASRALTSGLKSAGEAAVAVGSTVVKGATTALAGAAIGTATAAVSKGFSRLKGLDVAQARFKGLGLAGKELDAVMASVNRSVDGTAFSLPAAAQAASLFAASGIEAGKAMDTTLDALVAVSAAAGNTDEALADVTSVMQGLAASGKVGGAALKRLEDRGVAATQALAKEFKKTPEQIKEMVSRGEVSFEQFNQAMTASLGDMAAAMGTTWESMRGNFFSRLGNAASKLADPFYESAKRIVGALLPQASAMASFAATFTEPLADKLEPVIDRIVEKIEQFDLSNVDFKGMLAVLGPLAPLLGAVAGGLGSMLSTLPLIGPIFAGLTGPIGAVAGALVALFAIKPETMQAGFDKLNAKLPQWIDKMVSTASTFIPKLLSNLAANLPIVVKGIGQLLGTALSSAIAALPDRIRRPLQVLEVNVRSGLNKVWEVAGALSVDGAAGIVEAVKQRWKGADFEDAFVGINYTLAEVLDRAVGIVKGFIDTAGGVFKGLVGNAAPGFQELFRAIQPVLGLLPQLLSALSPVKIIFEVLLPLLPQIAEILGTLAGLIAGALASAIEAVTPLLTTIVGVFDTLIPIVSNLIAELLPPLVELIDSLIPIFELLLEVIMPIVAAIADALIPIIEALLPVVTTVFTIVADYVKTAMEVFGGLIDFLTGVFTLDWEKMWNGIKRIFTAIWEGIKTQLSNVWEFIKSTAATVWEAIKSVIMTPINLVKSGLSRVWGEISKALDKTWNGIKKAAETVWGLIEGYIVDPLKSAYEWITDSFGEISQWFEDLWNGIKETATSIIGSIGTAIETAWRGVKSAIKMVINGAINLANIGIRGINEATGGLSKAWTWAGVPRIPPIPEIPPLATGGVVSQPMLAIVGDAGPRNPEIVAPQKMLRQLFAEALAANSTSGNITVMISPQDLAGIRSIESFVDMVRVKARQG